MLANVLAAPVRRGCWHGAFVTFSGLLAQWSLGHYITLVSTARSYEDEDGPLLHPLAILFAWTKLLIRRFHVRYFRF